MESTELQAAPVASLIKRFLSLICVFLLIGCGSPITWDTAPGAPLPNGAAFCTGYDAASRCTGWTSESDQCIKPKGINEPQSVVPCVSIKKLK